jgi:hypothetical protein
MFRYRNIPAFLFSQRTLQGYLCKNIFPVKEQVMKEKFKFLAFFLAAALVLMACPNPAGDDEDGGNTTSLSFDNFSTPSIFVENKTGERLVAFKGSLNPSYLISGIPAYATNHGLRKDTALFNATGSFVLLLITEKQYNDNKSQLGALENQVFARVFAFYNHSATNNNVFQISSKIGGDGRLTVSNPTSFNVEIRKDGPTGEILGYAAAGMTSGNVIYLQAPESYDIYPVFKFYNPTDKELYSVTPKYTSGALEGKPFMKTIGLGGSNLTASFNLNEVNGAGTFNLSSGSVYFRVTNNSGTGLRFNDGDTPKITSQGIEVIPSSASETFTLTFTRNSDGTYPDQRNFAQLRIGTTQLMLTVPPQSYDLDYMYEIEVLGATGSDLVLGSVQKGNKVDLDRIFGLTN